MIFSENQASIGQFARHGIWENTLSFRVDAAPSIDELREYPVDGSELAFELFFDASFFGVRFTSTPALILEMSESIV